MNRIFGAFLMMATAVLLWLLPLTSAIYSFRTDLKTDLITANTASGNTTANVTLNKPIYSSDTSTLTLYSDLSSDIPLYGAYNAATKTLLITGLTDNTTRTLTVSYDTDALTGAGAFNTVLDRTPYIWMVIVAALPVIALVVLFRRRD